MSATIWDVLALDGPTYDDRAIRKAYAKRLKQIRPEDDPEGFMQLRDALDAARALAARGYAFDTVSEEVILRPDMKMEQDGDQLVISPKDPPQGTAPDDDPSHTLADLAADSPEQPTEPASPASDTGVEPWTGDPAFAEHWLSHAPLANAVNTHILTPDLRRSETEWLRLFDRAGSLDLDEFGQFEDGLLIQLGYYTNAFGSLPEDQAELRLLPDVKETLFERLGWNRIAGRDDRSRAIAALREQLGVGKAYTPGIDDPARMVSPSGTEPSTWKIVGGIILGLFILSRLLDLLGHDTSPPPRIDLGEPAPTFDYERYGITPPDGAAAVEGLNAPSGLDFPSADDRTVDLDELRRDQHCEEMLEAIERTGTFKSGDLTDFPDSDLEEPTLVDCIERMRERAYSLIRE